VLKLTDEYSGYTIDLTINNILGVYNSLMTRRLAMIEPRLLKLGTYLKKWNKSIKTNGYTNLTSYAIGLMLIVYL